MDWEALDLSFGSGKDKSVILSETMSRDEIFELLTATSKELCGEHYHLTVPSQQSADSGSGPQKAT